MSHYIYAHIHNQEITFQWRHMGGHRWITLTKGY